MIHLAAAAEAISQLVLLVASLSRLEIIIDAKHVGIKCTNLKLNEQIWNFVHSAIHKLTLRNLDREMIRIDFVISYF